MNKLKSCPKCGSEKNDWFPNCFHCKKCGFEQCYYSDDEITEMIKQSKGNKNEKKVREAKKTK